MKIDKQNGNVAFSDATHTYWDITNNQKYISVTTLISKFENVFDKEFWSAYKALEAVLSKEAFTVEKKQLIETKVFDPEILLRHGVSNEIFSNAQQAILDKWAEENQKSCDRGTAIHSQIENSFYENPKNISLNKFGIGGKFECRPHNYELDLKYGVYPEYLIHYKSEDGLLNLAGQIDLMVKDNNSITIIDHKGLPLDTEIPTITGWTSMKKLMVGDYVYDKDGNPCRVLEKSEIHYNPCYKITFSNGVNITADYEHRWLVLYNSTEMVVTTEDLHKSPEIYTIPSAKALESSRIKFDISPKDMGRFLRGIKVNTRTERKIFKLYPKFKINKFIPTEYLRGSIGQRTELLEGLSLSNELENNCLYIENGRLLDDCVRLLSSLGYNVTKRKTVSSDGVKETIIGTTLEYRKIDFLSIISVKPVETIPTQCIWVDSPSHTYLCTKYHIVTHNTNKQIKTRGFDYMKFPLMNLQDVNFNHYSLQLSTYAWMLQQINPEFVIKELMLNHYDHKDKNTVFKCEYLKDEVERMINYYKKLVLLEKKKEGRKRVEF